MALNTADLLNVVTNHGGVRREVVCNWNTIAASGRWDVLPLPERPAETVGTKLIFDRLTKDAPQNKDNILRRLGIMYRPALLQGKEIVVRWSPHKKYLTVPATPFPPLTGARTAELSVGKKRAKVKVTMGLIAEGAPTDVSGLFIAYDYRVIDPDRLDGLTERAAPPQLGWAELGDRWSLKTYKDGLDEREDALLMAKIRHEFADVIGAAEKQGASVVFDGVAGEVSCMVAGVLRAELEGGGSAASTSPAPCCRAGWCRRTGRVEPLTPPAPRSPNRC